MYVSATDSGVGFSLKPPKWLRKGAKSVFGAVKGLISGEPVQAGPIVLTAPSMAPPPPSPIDRIPGGGTTLAVVGIGAAVLLGVMMLSKKGRR